MGRQEDIKNNNIVVVMTSKEKYKEDIILLAKEMEACSTKCCYLTFTEPYGFITSNLKKNGIDVNKFFFIDTVTRKVQEPPKVDNCEFVTAPNALTEISVAFSKAINDKKCDSSLFDTLSSLLIYEDVHSLIQFVHNLLTKVRIAAGRVVFVALKDDMNSELIKDLHMFVDKVIDESSS